jgi:hypothetical protein
VVRNGKFFNARSIRDTTAVTSEPIGPADIGSMLLVAENSLNQAVTLQYQGSMDGTTWHDVGAAITVASSTGKDVQTLTDPWLKFRAKVTAAGTPTTGSFSCHWSGREVAE